MAIHVEDHPIDYADLEGEIPAGEYGGRKMETWDRGTWEPLGDPDDGMRKGDIKFVLKGQRLHGRFTLARLRQRGKQEAWFLIKGHDDEPRRERARRSSNEHRSPPPNLLEENRSISGTGAVRGSVPEKQAPQLCKLAETPPMGQGWISEIKFDGYRLLAHVEDGRARLMTRNGHEWTDRLPAVATMVAQVNVQSAVLDGELVALRQDQKLFFYLFDLLELGGWDLRAASSPIARQHWNVGSIGQGCCGSAGIPMAI
jgi:bifunctional non-homologous end joining protein LigD